MPKGRIPRIWVSHYTWKKENEKSINRVELPVPVEEVLKDLEAVILTHTHLDHWEAHAARLIPKYIPIFVQHAADKKLVQSQGFHDVRVTGIKTPFKGITITKTGGQHGSDEMFAVPTIAEFLDEFMGFVLRTPGQKTVYFQEILGGMNM